MFQVIIILLLIKFILEDPHLLYVQYMYTFGLAFPLGNESNE